MRPSPRRRTSRRRPDGEAQCPLGHVAVGGEHAVPHDIGAGRQRAQRHDQAGGIQLRGTGDREHDRPAGGGLERDPAEGMLDLAVEPQDDAHGGRREHGVVRGGGLEDDGVRVRGAGGAGEKT